MAVQIAGVILPQSQAKLGILLGSLVPAAVGIALLLTTQRYAEPISA
ncbi:MAG: hypothetical protein ACYCTW_01105 [Sulfuricella sp.]